MQLNEHGGVVAFAADLAQAMIARLSDSIDPSFAVDTALLGTGTAEAVKELARFCLLVVYFQVIENNECEALIINNSYEEYFMEVLKSFSGMDAEGGEVVLQGSSHSESFLFNRSSLMVPTSMLH